MLLAIYRALISRTCPSLETRYATVTLVLFSGIMDREDLPWCTQSQIYQNSLLCSAHENLSPYNLRVWLPLQSAIEDTEESVPLKTMVTVSQAVWQKDVVQAPQDLVVLKIWGGQNQHLRLQRSQEACGKMTQWFRIQMLDYLLEHSSLNASVLAPSTCHKHTLDACVWSY